jgi:hypothetical protein
MMFFKTTAGKDVQWDVKIDVRGNLVENLPNLNPLMMYNQSEMFDKIISYYRDRCG